MVNDMDTNLIVQLVAIVLGSNALFEFIKWIADRRGKSSPERQALLALCSERCETLLHKWIRTDAEDRSIAKWAAIKRLYDAYRALGGNGEIEELYKIACEIKPTEK